MSVANSLPADAVVNIPQWKQQMENAVTTLGELARLLRCPELVATAATAARQYPVRIPRSLLSRICPNGPSDPVLRQFVPQEVELNPSPGYTDDPLNEGTVRAGRVIQKYAHRCLIVTTDRCAVHCRFCFRRHLARPEPSGQAACGASPPTSTCDPLSWVDQVAQDTSLREVILSGGDPLTLPDELLETITRRLAQCSHLRRLRIHTRMPVVIPSRVDGNLLRWLRATRLVPIVVLHVNHPAEIDSAAAAALERLVDGGIPVLSQTVLLRAVNDNVEVLAELFERLVDLRIMPYYLHQLDRVSGAAHFEVPLNEGKRLVARLREILPGYAVPRYVREIPGLPFKQLIG